MRQCSNPVKSAEDDYKAHSLIFQRTGYFGFEDHLLASTWNRSFYSYMLHLANHIDMPFADSANELEQFNTILGQHGCQLMFSLGSVYNSCLNHRFLNWILRVHHPLISLTDKNRLTD